MRRIYFVTEGPTDQLVLEGLIAHWLGSEDFISRQIQPPSSAYAEELDSNLSDGWKGVVAWCKGERPDGPVGRDEALRMADCLVIHVDADIAADPDFIDPPFPGANSPASNTTNWIRTQLANWIGSPLPANVLFCVPSRDLEAWTLSALHPDVADQHMPIECRIEPGTLLVQRAPHRLVRRKDGRLKKEVDKYANALPQIINGWANVAAGNPPRCPEAFRFEDEAKAILGI